MSWLLFYTRIYNPIVAVLALSVRRASGQAASPLRPGLPEGGAVSPFRLELPEGLFLLDISTRMLSMM